MFWPFKKKKEEENPKLPEFRIVKQEQLDPNGEVLGETFFVQELEYERYYRRNGLVGLTPCYRTREWSDSIEEARAWVKQMEYRNACKIVKTIVE